MFPVLFMMYKVHTQYVLWDVLGLLVPSFPLILGFPCPILDPISWWVHQVVISIAGVLSKHLQITHGYGLWASLNNDFHWYLLLPGLQQVHSSCTALICLEFSNQIWINLCAPSQSMYLLTYLLDFPFELRLYDFETLRMSAWILLTPESCMIFL